MVNVHSKYAGPMYGTVTQPTVDNCPREVVAECNVK